jgi:hypothetical protein
MTGHEGEASKSVPRPCGHVIPHDGDRESLWLEGGTKGVMSGLGFHPTIVERPRNKLEAIAAARAALARCQFD